MSVILSRRGFLVASGAAILAVSVPSIAKNIILPDALFIPNSTSKYNTALEMFDVVVAANNRVLKYDAAGERLPYNINIPGTKELSTLFNEMLVYVHATFEPPVINAENIAQCKAFLDTRHENAGRYLLEGTPPALADAIWPVGLVKMALRDYQLFISYRDVPEFNVFVDRYKSLIMT